MNAAFCLLLAASLGAALPHVPEGLVIEPLAVEPEVRFPMFAALDDRGRLFVAESSGGDLYAELQAGSRRCRIRVLEDPDPSGRYRSSRVFADRLVFPMGLAWRDGRLYVADPPELVAYDDQGGRAGRRTVILSGFGHRDNGSLHGLVFGPDGRLYLTMGSPDGYSLRRRDGSLLTGASGALLRCRPDGSEVEVLCRGFENLVEVAFTPRGEILGTDNWFQLPSGGVRDALVHLVEGGLYPRHPDQGTPQPVTGPPLPAAALYPAVALSGLERYRGRALPGQMRGNLFSAQHNARKVVRHVLLPEGSTFRTQDYDFVTSDDPDFHPSDVLEAADGSLLVLDTGSWYVHHCPTGQIRKVHATGGIYRVRPVTMPPIADPYGLQIDWPGASVQRLAELLADPRPKVQDRAQRTLAERGSAAVGPLSRTLSAAPDSEVGCRAVWTLAAIADCSALGPLRWALARGDADVAAAAARALALREDRGAASELCRRLSAESAPLRLAAAEALAHCGDRASLPALWRALDGPLDRFQQHAVVHALHHLADAGSLAAALREPSSRVQQAALLLVAQPPRPDAALTPEMVLPRAASPDAALRQTVLEIVQRRPAWCGHAVALVQSRLEAAGWSEESQRVVRELALAFQGQREMQEAIALALRPGDRRQSASRRAFLLETLADTELAALPEVWVEALRQSLADSAPSVRLQAVRTAAVLQVPQLDDVLAALADSTQDTAQMRLAALRGVLLRRPQLSPAAFQFLLDQLALPDDPLARLAAVEVVGRARLTPAQLPALLSRIADDALVSPTVILPGLPRSLDERSAEQLLGYLTTALQNGWHPGEAELEPVLKSLPAPLEARCHQLRELVRQGSERQRRQLAEFEPLLSDGDARRGRDVFLGKRALCSTCHRVGAEGGEVGPDLTRVGAIRAGRDILEAIVAPGSTIAQGYEQYTIVTRGGQLVSGVVSRQTTETVVVRAASGAAIQLPRAEIEQMTRQSTSLMPEGLPRALSTAEFRDLLAYLQSLR